MTDEAGWLHNHPVFRGMMTDEPPRMVKRPRDEGGGGGLGAAPVPAAPPYLVELRLRDGKLTAVRDVLANSSTFFARLLDESLGTSSQDADGAYFISADVAPMRIVLKYLETHKLTYPPALKDELVDLADMLCLEQLLAEVRDGFNPFLLRSDVYAMREHEREWHRKLSNPIDEQHFEGVVVEADSKVLIDIAARKSEFKFSSEPLGSSLALLFDCHQEALADGTPSIDASLFAQPRRNEEFQRALFRLADQRRPSAAAAAPAPPPLLERLDLSNVVIAGGAVLRVLLGTREAETEGDIDLFLVGLDDDALMWAKVQALFVTLKAQVAAEYAAVPQTNWRRHALRDILVVRSSSAITFVLPGRRNIQVMLTRYACVADVLLNFDIDVCQVAWVPCKGVLCTPSAMRAINHRIVLADPTIRHKGCRHMKARTQHPLTLNHH